MIDLTRRKVFGDVMKDPDVERLPQIIRLGPQSSQKHAWRREVQICRLK